MKRKRKSVQMREWDRRVSLLEQGITPDGLPINPPGKSAGIMAHPDGRGGWVVKERFWMGIGHHSYTRVKDGEMVREWYSVHSAE